MEMPAFCDPVCMLLPLGIIQNSQHEIRGCLSQSCHPRYA